MLNGDRTVVAEFDDVADSVQPEGLAPDRQGSPYPLSPPVLAHSQLIDRRVGEVAANGFEIGFEVTVDVDQGGLARAVVVMFQRRYRNAAPFTVEVACHGQLNTVVSAMPSGRSVCSTVTV